jgi:hypothetical protein
MGAKPAVEKGASGSREKADTSSVGAIAAAFDDHRFSMVKESIQNGAGDGGIVLIGRDEERALFVALAEDLEKQVGTRLVDGEASSSSIAKIVGLR